MLDFGREIAAVVFVLGVLAASLIGLRRFQAPRQRPTGPLRAIGKVRLSGNLVLHLVDCSGEQCLVAEQKAACSLIPLRSVLRAAAEETPTC